MGALSALAEPYQALVLLAISPRQHFDAMPFSQTDQLAATLGGKCEVVDRSVRISPANQHSIGVSALTPCYLHPGDL